MLPLNWKQDYASRKAVFEKASKLERETFNHLKASTPLSVTDDFMLDEIRIFHKNITGIEKPLDNAKLIRFLIRCFYSDYISEQFLDF